jgi:hypothetical protein
MSSMTRQKHEAERLRIGIRGGWLNVSEAVAWADTQIAESPVPHASLLDVAIGANRTREEMAALLGAVPGSSDVVEVMRACLGDLLLVVERELALARGAARWVEAAAQEGHLPEAQFGWEPWALDDAFALADQSIGNHRGGSGSSACVPPRTPE